jgi:NADH-quinone oxidoreductase subunit M
VSILTILGIIPLVGSVIVGFTPTKDPAKAKIIALVFAVATFVVAVLAVLQFDPNSAEAFQFVAKHDWIPSLGISFAVGVDGIGLILVFLATLLVPVVIWAGWNDVEDAAEQSPGQTQGNVRGYFALMLVLEAMMIGVFVSLDVVLFYIFFEVILIPVYFMIGRYGTGRRTYAAVKFLVYSLLGGLVMLAALAGLWWVSLESFGSANMYFPDLLAIDIDPTVQGWLFWGFFIAFAIKAPLWPVHTWLPDAAGSSTPGTATLLIGVLDKIGTFGMLRLCLPLFPEASQQYAPVIIAISVIGIFYGALVAIGQSDMKRMFGYVSISHFGFMTMGIFAFTSIAQSGATFYMLGHGLSTAMLFLVAGYLISRRKSAQVADFGGVVSVAPVAAGLFLIAGLSALALPGFMTFQAEFLVLVGTFERYAWVAAFSTLAIVLAALYILFMYQRSMTGPTSEGVKSFKDLNLRERWAIAPLVVVLIGLGFYPSPAMNVINPAVERTMDWVGATNPPPAISDAASQAPVTIPPVEGSQE